MLCWCLIILILIDIEKHFARSIERQEFTIPDYDFHWTTKPDFRKSLSLKFSQRKKSDEKIRNFMERFAKDTEYFDDVPHIEINSARKIKYEADKFEKSFKRVIGMVGVTYNYKRDIYWRTWREVTFPNSSKQVICYKCHNIINRKKANSTHCKLGGYWALEDKPPPCSYEILFFKDEKQLCVANYWQLSKTNLSLCPTIIKFKELSYCRIPMITRLRVTPDYSKNVSERASTVICQGREECEFTTFYKIESNIISFRIINSTNDTIYSRIMKNNGKNYACTEECGRFDFKTMKTKRVNNHLVLNLIKDYPAKKKRENSWNTHKKTNYNNALRHNLLVKRHKYVIEQPFQSQQYSASTVSFCKQMFLKEHADDYK